MEGKNPSLSFISIKVDFFFHWVKVVHKTGKPITIKQLYHNQKKISLPPSFSPWLYPPLLGLSLFFFLHYAFLGSSLALMYIVFIVSLLKLKILTTFKFLEKFDSCKKRWNKFLKLKLILLVNTTNALGFSYHRHQSTLHLQRCSIIKDTVFPSTKCKYLFHIRLHLY